MQTYTPLEYLKIDIATNYGDIDINGKTVDLDKVDFDQRISWFNEQEANDQLVALIPTSDKPALYFAGLQAYERVLAGQPIGYPISLDACSSGLQILATLSNCEKSAKRCGVISTGHREDAYMSLFQDMKAKSKKHLSATRSELKDAIMTALYGSLNEPKKLFNYDEDHLKLFYEILEQEIPGAWNLNLALMSLWQPYSLKHEWTLPDGFQVSMKNEDTVVTEVSFFGEAIDVYSKQPKGSRSGLSLCPNLIHSIDGMIVREITRRCNYNQDHVEYLRELCPRMLSRGATRRKVIQGRSRPKDKLLKSLWSHSLASGFLSFRVLNLIDEKNVGLISVSALQNMLDQLPAKPFPVLAIHDCFRIHPNYGNDLRQQYALILAQLADSNILSDLATQITGRQKTFVKVGNIANQVKNADYALS